MTTAELPQCPTIKQSAQYINASERFVRRRIADGTLRAVRVGPRAIRVDKESLLKLAGQGLDG